MNNDVPASAGAIIIIIITASEIPPINLAGIILKRDVAVNFF